MVKLYLPETFVNTVKDLIVENGTYKYEPRVVTSLTQKLAVPYSGPSVQSYTKEAVANKKVLELSPGETKEFSDEEAKFFVERYPFIQIAKEPETSSAETSATNPAVAPATVPSLGETTVAKTEEVVGLSAEVPTNFMQLKKYAKEKGVEVLLTDKKPDILAKLAALK